MGSRIAVAAASVGLVLVGASGSPGVPVEAVGPEVLSPELPLERSYIYPFGGLVGNGGGLWFEASLAPGFELVGSTRYGLVITPKVVMRMLRDESAPIRSPSYMPQVGIYRFARPRDGRLRYWVLGLGHHSNGGDAALFRDGVLDRESGNFATNWLQLGWHRGPRAGRGWPGALSASVEWHPDLFMDRLLEGQYAPVRVQVGTLSHFRERWSWRHRARVLLGRGGPNLDEAWRRLGFESEVLVDLPWWRQVSLAVNLTLGEDYYNVEFPGYLSVLRVGLATNPGLPAR